MEPPAAYDARVELLTSYRLAILRWFDGKYEPEGMEQLRSFINRNTRAAETAVKQAGCFGLMTMGPPPAVGGLIVQNMNPFEGVFQDFWGRSVIPTVSDMCDQAIGVYEHLSKGTGLVSLPTTETVDVVSAIERSLRPTFRAGPPKSEKEVQKEVETILNALGLSFNREQDSAPVGPRAFKPDFVLPDLDLAVEVKLASPSHGESVVQEELTSDIAAYRTRWRHVAFIIYDLGVIADPDRLRRENMRLFGVTVLVIKH
jgi:hypothetical protein